MTDTQQLLAEFALNGSEKAFSEIVDRYVNLVYSTALRTVADNSGLAEDVTQRVFISLAEKAPTLSRDVMLGGWLHQHTYYLAMRSLRDEQRRQRREREAMEQQSLENESDANWDQLTPVLDSAIIQLNEEDRTAILLRFFEQRDFRAIGEALKSNEGAARMRVNRALDKLRAELARRGIGTTAAALSCALAANAVNVAPAGLAASLSKLALSATASAVSATTVTTIAMTAFQKTVITATIAVALGAGVYESRQASHWHQQLLSAQQLHAAQIRQLEQERDDARKRVATLLVKPAPHRPAPPVQPTTPRPDPANASNGTNILAQFPSLKNKAPNKLTADQLDGFLKAHGRDATSLLAAYRTSGLTSLLDEAMQKHPNSPEVALEASLRKDLSPEDRRQWLEAFKQSDPGNALPDYLSALNYFKSGNTDQALQELLSAANKQNFNNYATLGAQENQQAYLAAGYSMADAQAISPLQQSLMHSGSEDDAEQFAPFPELNQLRQLKELAINTVELAKAYKQSGDEASAQAVLAMVANLGTKYSTAPGANGLNQLCGTAAEGMALYQLDPASPYGSNGQTVQDRINQIREQRQAVHGLYDQAVPLLSQMTDQEWAEYNSRARMFGEPAALQWVSGKFGHK